ncbi:hypothetical protein T484DRAFT_1832132 [Baffinella frigidus]|nr:hypothetical protein T484DRAFT_1832132 [Cryptophyta sp. CCMP2293]
MAGGRFVLLLLVAGHVAGTSAQVSCSEQDEDVSFTPKSRDLRLQPGCAEAEITTFPHHFYPQPKEAFGEEQPAAPGGLAPAPPLELAPLAKKFSSDFLFGGTLLALSKAPKPGSRPIAIGIALRHLALKAIIPGLNEELTDYLTNAHPRVIQLAGGVEDE